MARKHPFKLLLAQIPQSGSIEANLNEIQSGMDAAKKSQADLLVLPECALTGYGPSFHSAPSGFDKAELHRALQEVRKMTRRDGVAVLLGTHLPAGRDWTNSAILISSGGRRIARYDKAHLYGDDPDYYRPGDRAPKPERVGRAKIGMQICFDIRFPELFRGLALAGADVILVPSFIHGKHDMWKRSVIESHLSSRAAENGRFVVFVNAAGRNQNAPSSVADPRGIITHAARRGARQFLDVALDLREINNRFLSSRRPKLYDSSPPSAQPNRRSSHA